MTKPKNRDLTLFYDLQSAVSFKEVQLLYSSETGFLCILQFFGSFCIRPKIPASFQWKIISQECLNLDIASVRFSNMGDDLHYVASFV